MISENDATTDGVTPAASQDPAPKVLTPEAKRALAEAEARRRDEAALQNSTSNPKEVGGRTGPDPVRYGDWETGGIVSDF